MRSSATPGEPGNLVLAGHRTSWFEPLEKLTLGDVIEVAWPDVRRRGLRLQTYAVETVRVVAPDDVSLLAPTSHDVLTLVTCYPFGRSPNSPLRYVVRALPRGDARHPQRFPRYTSRKDLRHRGGGGAILAREGLYRHEYLGRVCLQNGMFEDARVEFQEAITHSGGKPRFISFLGEALARAGREGEARKLLEQLKELATRKYVSPYDLARICVALGETEAAFHWLHRACEARAFGLSWLKVEPSLDSLRSDPRFPDLLRRIGLPA